MLCAGRVGRVAAVPEAVALSGADLQLGGHHAPAARREQAIPDDGTHVAQDHEERQGEPTGELPIIKVVKLEHDTCQPACHPTGDLAVPRQPAGAGPEGPERVPLLSPCPSPCHPVCRPAGHLPLP